jgi:hypothetical protein
MSILKDVINKKMKNINDGINNLTQQISGRNKTPKKGTYAQLPTDEVLSRFDQDITNDSLTPKIKAASKIKAAVKRTIDQDKYKFNQEWEQLKDDIPLELETYRRAEAQRTLTRALKSKLSRKKMNKLINEKNPTLSSQFNSYPNAMKPNPKDTDSINAMNKHVIDKLQKQLLQKQTLRDELIDVFETDRKQTQAATMLKDTEQQYERLSTQYAKTRAGKIIAPAVKRSSANKHYNQAVGMMEDAQIYNDKLKKLRKTQNKIAFEDFASNIQKQPESVSNFGKLSLGVAKQQRQVNKQIEASERAQSQQKISNFGKLASKAPKLKIIRQDKQTAATATLQNAMRRKTDMMKKRQLVDEAKLKGMEETHRQIEAAKTDTLKKMDVAATQLQATTKRVAAQNNIAKIKKAKDWVGAAVKRLLTERVDPHYINQIKKTVIMNKPTVGQRLVVNKKLKLVSKKRHDAGVFGYETRQDFLDLAQTYKPIMTKGQKK